MKPQKHIIGAAIAFATRMHDGQFDKQGMPYILHCLTVMHKLKTDDEKLMAVGVLHDVIEDTKATYQDLRNIGMPEDVIASVRALTKMPGQTNEEYLEAVAKDFMAILAKLEDLDHNMDPKRLKGVEEKDRIRLDKYVKSYHFLEKRRNQYEGTSRE